MENVSDGMKSLCEGILKSHEDRSISIKQLKDQTGIIRSNARNFLNDSRRFHEEMGRALKKGLLKGREDLMRNVHTLKEDFRKKEKEVSADLNEEGTIWSKMGNDLRHRKAKSP